MTCTWITRPASPVVWLKSIITARKDSHDALTRTTALCCKNILQSTPIVVLLSGSYRTCRNDAFNLTSGHDTDTKIKTHKHTFIMPICTRCVCLFSLRVLTLCCSRNVYKLYAMSRCELKCNLSIVVAVVICVCVSRATSFNHNSKRVSSTAKEQRSHSGYVVRCHSAGAQCKPTEENKTNYNFRASPKFAHTEHVITVSRMWRFTLRCETNGAWWVRLIYICMRF